jgi:hypothetical protein
MAVVVQGLQRSNGITSFLRHDCVEASVVTEMLDQVSPLVRFRLVDEPSFGVISTGIRRMTAIPTARERWPSPW